MPTIEKAQLLVRRSNAREVELPGVGTVSVRGLTRAEALKLQGVEMDAAEMEVFLVALAMVEPALTEDEVREWQQVSPAGEISAITEAVLELSGMNAEAPKESMAAFRG